MITKKEFIFVMKFIAIYTIVCIAFRIFLNVIEPKAEAKIIQPIKVEEVKETKKEIKKETKKEPVIIRKQQKWETKEQAEEKQGYVDYIWKKTKNIDMILTFEFESGYNKEAINKNYKKTKSGEFILDENGNKIVKSTDHGIPQLNTEYHMAFIQSEDFEDPYKQIDYGIKLYLAYEKSGIIGERFYGYNYRQRIRGRYYINQEAYNEYWTK